MALHVSRRTAIALTSVALVIAKGLAFAQDSHTSSGSHSTGGGHASGGMGRGSAGAGARHLPGGDGTEHNHDEGGNTDTSHEHADYSGAGHDSGANGPRYRGGRTHSGRIGRGEGRSLEDRVFKGS